jgi:hypothetical protein
MAELVDIDFANCRNCDMGAERAMWRNCALASRFFAYFPL